ncbi:uncharacterized protein LOC130657551 [Hydractinia symbiolongicarpus]|uniref:uncharacterized protein LOC130657551 n=1 Tax=Hydractinia symbiolongicarpus TaxID=13093 RepID=UPI00254E1CB5|nr:uncharacterized protein LOC130657551 [Hydractinia symbiolongicarpus]
MAFKILTLILLLFAIKYVFTEGNLYVIHNVYDNKKGKVTNHYKGFTRTTCLVRCGNDQDCDTAYFKPDQDNNSFGECWFVKEGGDDDLKLPKISDGEKVEWFENVSYYETKKKNTSYKADNWKLQATNVCFGAKNGSYGKFTLNHTGTMTRLKLKHTGEESTLNCRSDVSNVTSRWGCHYYGEEWILTVITDKNNTIIIPNSKHGSYILSGYNASSPYLQFDNLNISANYGDELRIWYFLDLIDHYYESVSEGRSCADVHAVFYD